MSFNNESVKHHQGSFNCNVFNWIHYSLYEQYCEIMFSVIQACSVFSLVFPEQQKKKKEQPAFYFFDWSVTSHPLVLSGICWVALDMFGSSLNFRKASHYRGWKNQWVFFVGGFRCDSCFLRNVFFSSLCSLHECGNVFSDLIDLITCFV